MVNFDVITNPKLKELVMKSASINSLEEIEIQNMVNRFAALPEEAQQTLILSLSKEQLIESPPETLESLQEKNAAAKQIKKDFEKTVLQENEKAESAKSDQEAENLLNNLMNI